MRATNRVHLQGGARKRFVLRRERGHLEPTEIARRRDWPIADGERRRRQVHEGVALDDIFPISSFECREREIREHSVWHDDETPYAVEPRCHRAEKPTR